MRAIIVEVRLAFLTIDHGRLLIGHTGDYESPRQFEPEQINGVLNLSELLQGLSIDSIKTCKGCRKYFLS